MDASPMPMASASAAKSECVRMLKSLRGISRTACCGPRVKTGSILSNRRQADAVGLCTAGGILHNVSVRITEHERGKSSLQRIRGLLLRAKDLDRNMVRLDLLAKGLFEQEAGIELG